MSIQAVAWVLEHSEATDTDRLVLLSIANHANDAWQAWPSVATIARETRKSESAVHRALRSLVEGGRLTVGQNEAPDQRIPHGRKPNLYTIERGVPRMTPQPADAPSTGVPPATPEGCHVRAGGVSRVAPKPSLNHQELPASAAPLAPKQRQREEMWEAFVALTGRQPTTRSEGGKWGAGIKDLLQAGATPDEVRRRAGAYRRKFGDDIELNPKALAANWSACDGGNERAAAEADPRGVWMAGTGWVKER